jgi:acetyl-CoA carboxylase biotin carboxylase subunit
MFYDPLIGKVIVHSGDRVNAVRTGILDILHIEGVKTNIPALLRVVGHERFLSGDYDTGLLGK